MTDVVVTVNVAVVAPAATVTLAGTVAEAELSESDTLAPPFGAAALSLTVPVEAFPPTTVDGLTETVESVGPVAAGGFTVSTAVCVAPAKTAEIVADVDAVTDVVVMVNVALVAPAATVTLAGTAAAAELSESDTAAPPAGAAALSVTVPVDELPPTTVDGLSDTAESVGPVAPCGLIVSVALFVTFW